MAEGAFLDIELCPMTRRLTPEQANAAYDVLVECAGADDKSWSRESFIWHISECHRPASEYRFGGLLGYGGKLRNNRCGIYVDCYPEHETAERLATIERTNVRLAALFGEGGGG